MSDSCNLSSLKKILSSKQIKLLKAYSRNCGINEIIKELKIKRSDIILEFIYLGKSLAIFEWLHCKLVPPLGKSQEFIDGFVSSTALLTKRIKDGIRKEKIQRKKKPHKKTKS